MKYEVIVTENGFGVCDTPEHHFGNKKLFHEVFDQREVAMRAAADETKALMDKYEICHEWKVISDGELKWIKTRTERINNWDHNYEVKVYQWTDEEWEELAG